MWKGARRVSDGQKEGKTPEKSNFVQTCNLLSQYIKEKGSLKNLNLEIGGKVESLEAIVKSGPSHAASASKPVNSLTDKGKSVLPQLPTEQQASAGSFPRTAAPDSCINLVEDASIKASTSKEAVTVESKTAQLTIFYGGRVLVFNDFPADKVRELVSVAKKGSSQMSYGLLPNISHEKPKPTNVEASSSGARDGLPPRPQPSYSHKPVGISSIGCNEKVKPLTSVPMDSISRSEQQPSSPSEANGSDLPIARRSSLHRFLEKRKDRAAARGPYQVQNREEQPSSSSKCDEELELRL